MKQTIRFTALLLCLTLALFSCKKNKKESEWSSFFGYSVDDIAGKYSYSNVSDAFDVITENDDVHICMDADIDIQKLTESTVEFDINCPEAEFRRSFVGCPAKNKNDNLLQLSSGYWKGRDGTIRAYNVLADVYKNDQSQIRLHGFASLDVYKIISDSNQIGSDTIVESRTAYYFDVIKD